MIWKAWLMSGNQNSFDLVSIPAPRICYKFPWAALKRLCGNQHARWWKEAQPGTKLDGVSQSPFLLSVGLSLSFPGAYTSVLDLLQLFWEADRGVFRESHCLFWSGLKAFYSPFGWLFQQKGSKQIRNKQFQSQTSLHKPSVKQSPWISSHKVEVEQYGVFLKSFYNEHQQSRLLHVAIIRSGLFFPE